MTGKKTVPFEPLEVSLDQRNLIEASAGTGKTYSIALLVVRLLLEPSGNNKNPLTIDQILMVTFTKYAVAELETRIRQFIRTALRISQHGAAGEDQSIASIVNRSTQKNGKEKTTDWLKQAVQSLDETAIMTIHRFCQQMLTEYAFDTEQTFGTTAISGSDYSELILQSANETWRTYITVLSLPILEIIKPFLSKDTLIEMAEKTIAGKQLWIREGYQDQILMTGQQRFLEVRKQDEEEIEAIENSMLDYLRTNGTKLKQASQAFPSAKKWLNEQPDLFEDPQALLDKIFTSKKHPYTQSLFPDIIKGFEEKAVIEQKIENDLITYYNQLIQFALHDIQRQVVDQKEKNGWVSFDDMIVKVRNAVMSNEELCGLIRKKYKAVFIDEFQDTDSVQYEIFSQLFNTQTLLFYIGDPKQSIYAFRKADMNTYFKARNEGVDRILEMNTNYRSSADVIEGLNLFFKPTVDFDTFYFEGNTDTIEYISVQTPPESNQLQYYFDDKPVPPISIISNLPNKEALIDATAAQVAEILRNPYCLFKEGTTERVKPSDIGILVSTNGEARNIKNKLAAFKIPSVTLEDDKVLKSRQAKELYHILHAVVTMEKDKIQKALMTEIAGLSMQDMLRLNQEVVHEKFKTYQQVLFSQEKGVYQMLMMVMNDFRVRERMLDLDKENGERILSNCIQIMELINEAANFQQYTPHELLSWLGKAVEGKAKERDAFVQRIDNDETAVKIITVHKSKGLEYKVVLVPNLDMDTQKKNHVTTEEFRSELDGQYYFDQSCMLTKECEEWRIRQSEQENRRLLYVALTRAKYKCYVFSYNKRGKSTLRNFINAIAENHPTGIEHLIEWPDASPLTPALYKYRTASASVTATYLEAKNFSLTDMAWRKMSYSALNPPHAFLNYSSNSIGETQYDRFIFEQLKKGAHTGNLLHYIFEQADFTNPTQWNKIIQKAAKRLGASIDADETDGLCQMMQHVLQVNILAVGFSLNSISNQQKMNELEFDFPVQPFPTKEMQRLSPDETPWHIQDTDTLQGIMNGKMDLFFEQGGKYYILDWKSNHLGNQTADYGTTQVLEAMTANNYHLQYHLYTVALCLYLRWRLPDFDYDRDFGGVIYLFVRGVRVGEDTGIFYHKPSKALIDEMLQLFGC